MSRDIVPLRNHNVGNIYRLENSTSFAMTHLHATLGSALLML